MKTYNVITTFENGNPVLPAGCGHSYLSEPEITPAYVRVYCYTDEQVKALLADPVRYPFVTELYEKELTPEPLKPSEPDKLTEGMVLDKDDKLISVETLKDCAFERVWVKKEVKPIDVETIEIKEGNDGSPNRIN